MFINLFDAFRYHVRARDTADALIVEADGTHGVERWTWEELAGLVRSVAQQLHLLLDPLPRDSWCVGYPSRNSLADVLIALACMKVGAVEVPIDGRLSPEEIESRWRQIGGVWLDDATLCQFVDAAKADTSPPSPLSLEDDDRERASLVLWTSGTTGQPLGVTLSVNNLCGNAEAKLEAVPQTVNDVRLCVLPLCHAYARTCDFGTWLLSGCTMAISLGMDGWRRLGPVVSPTLANTVPSIADKLLVSDREELGLTRLKLLGCGGAAMSEASFAAWKTRGVTVIQGYGLTETSPVICSATPDNARPGLVGTFVRGWEYRLRDGRLHVRGPHNMLGYWNREAATAVRIDDAKWLDTGDLAEIDRESGQVRILGRADDVIVLSSGRKIHPRSIESVVEGVAGIDHAMVVGDADGLRLYLDGDADENVEQAITEAIAALPKWQRICQFGWFEPRLSREAGELTAKGTLRRQQIADRIRRG